MSFTSNQARRRAPSKCSDVTSVMCQIIARFDSLVDAKRRRRARLVDRKAIKVISHLVAILITVSYSNSVCWNNQYSSNLIFIPFLETLSLLSSAAMTGITSAKTYIVCIKEGDLIQNKRYKWRSNMIYI